MGAQKHGSKGSGGGFLHLFDWNAKSRKKLFSSKSESPEQPKQTKRTDSNMPMTRFNLMDVDDMIGGMSLKGSSDYSCATSVTDEDGYGTKAPGVVARLMGLDSLPTVNFSDTYSNPSFDSQSVKDSSASYLTKDPEYEPNDYYHMEPVSRPITVKPQKMVISRAVEKFQTETLPPKSAKTIPVTRNMLLSPIKSSGFVSSSNPARIMEAASKIPLVGSVSSTPSLSCSNPFRVKTSRDRVENSTRKPKIPEPSRRPLESTNVKNVKSQQSLEPKKSISLALQAKANVQKRQGLSHRVQSVRTLQKNPVSSNVLKQNNQKQNSLVDRGKSATKSSQARKPVPQKPNHKKEPYSTTRRKRSMEENGHTSNHTEKNSVGDTSYRSNKSDIVSFTFTAPITGLLSSNLIKHTPESTSNPSNMPSLTHNVIGSDALSNLLEQKLRELSVDLDSVSQDSLSAKQIQVKDAASPMDVDTELSDSASSVTRVTKWEPEYVKEVLSNIETMFVEFSIGRTRKLVNPHVFDRLGFGKSNEHVTKLRRELMFNCVSECMETRCRVWGKGLAIVRTPDRLAQQVYREIQGWEEMKDCMVDELVDADMSGPNYKKWLDFDVEAFEIGVEIQSRLLDSLMDEIVDDILLL